jgi:Family of unknown function (DUF6994)
LDTPGYPKKDPDAFSPTLGRYQQLLWSKRLPSGEEFELDVTAPPFYLHHRSQLGEFWLASDAVIPTFRREKRLSHIINQIPEEERESFIGIGYTIGGMMVFPANRVGGKMTINGARGFHPRTKELFGDFRGYVDFFLLQDLVTADCSAVKFFMPFEDFNASPLPGNAEAYRAYRQLAVDFIKARNHRIRMSC